jgi:hypothetical protein
MMRGPAYGEEGESGLIDDANADVGIVAAAEASAARRTNSRREIFRDIRMGGHGWKRIV